MYRSSRAARMELPSPELGAGLSRVLAPTRPGLSPEGHSLLSLQGFAGNRTVAGLIQTRLRVGPAVDAHEREADRLAEEVVGGGARPTMQAKRVAISPGQIRTKLRVGAPGESFDRKTNRMAGGVAEDSPSGGAARPSEKAPSAPADVEQGIALARGGGQALPAEVRVGMEAALGASFGDVRVHFGARATALNDRLGARAFTTGKDIFVHDGEPPLHDQRGRKLLAHELAHVTQQQGLGALDGVAQRCMAENCKFGESCKGGELCRQDPPTSTAMILSESDPPAEDADDESSDSEQRDSKRRESRKRKRARDDDNFALTSDDDKQEAADDRETGDFLRRHTQTGDPRPSWAAETLPALKEAQNWTEVKVKPKGLATATHQMDNPAAGGKPMYFDRSGKLLAYMTIEDSLVDADARSKERHKAKQKKQRKQKKQKRREPRKRMSTKRKMSKKSLSGTEIDHKTQWVAMSLEHERTLSQGTSDPDGDLSTDAENAAHYLAYNDPTNLQVIPRDHHHDKAGTNSRRATIPDAERKKAKLLKRTARKRIRDVRRNQDSKDTKARVHYQRIKKRVSKPKWYRKRSARSSSSSSVRSLATSSAITTGSPSMLSVPSPASQPLPLGSGSSSSPGTHGSLSLPSLAPTPQGSQPAASDAKTNQPVRSASASSSSSGVSTAVGPGSLVLEKDTD